MMLCMKTVAVFGLVILQSLMSQSVLRYPVFTVSTSYSTHNYNGQDDFQARSSAVSDIDDGRPIYKDLAPIKPRADYVEIDRIVAREAIMAALKENDKKDRFTKPSEDLYSIAFHKDFVRNNYPSAFGLPEYKPKPEIIKKPITPTRRETTQQNGPNPYEALYLLKKNRKPFNLDVHIPSLINIRFENGESAPFGIERLPELIEDDSSGRSPKLLELLLH